ncbi:hypothetical protein [Azospirillum sp. sgz301742]
MNTATYTLDAEDFAQRVDEARTFALESTRRLDPATAARVLLRTATLAERAIEGANEPVADDDKVPHLLCAVAAACGLVGHGEPLTPFAVGLRSAAAEVAGETKR